VIDRPVLHLSLPVDDLRAAKDFYERTLGCRIGRDQEDWFDAWFYGLQLTLQLRPMEVMDVSQPEIHSDAELNGKLGGKLADPSGNIIEIKFYADAADYLS